MEAINRLKVVLAVKKRTNTTQPSLDALRDISNALEVNIQELLVPTHVNK